MLWALTFTLFAMMSVASAQSDPNDTSGRLYYNLPFIIVPVAVFIIFVIGIIIGVYIIYRVKYYGAFCCCGLRMRYKPNYRSDVESNGDKALPPYIAKPHPLTAPPNYQDALKDEMVDSEEGNSTDKMPLVV